MPRRARADNPCGLETTKQARRAYVRAGGRVFTAEEIRRAEREAAKDKLARTIEANEKRRAEKERRRKEKEVKGKEEQKKLVQQGKLPRESLWGRVRSSQPRLHHFFTEPQQREGGAEGGDEAGLPGDGLGSEEEGLSPVEEEANGDSLDHLGRPLSPAPAFDDRTPRKHETVAEWRCAEDKDDGTWKRPDEQLSFSASQLGSQFADDADLEAELNGAFLPSELPERVSPRRPGNHATAQRAATSLRKRKAENDLSATLPLAQPTCAVLTELPASQLNRRAQRKDQLHKASATGPGVKASTLSVGCPTNRPREATVSIEEHKGDKSDHCREKRDAQRTAPEARTDPQTSYAVGRSEMDASVPCPVPAPNLLSRQSPANLRAAHEPSRNDRDPEPEFEGDLTDEDFEFASSVFNISEAAAAAAPTPCPGRSLSSSSSAAARPANLQQPLLLPPPPPPSPPPPAGMQPRLPDPQTSAHGPNLPSSTPSSWCDFDNGVSDADLAGLFDGFSGKQSEEEPAEKHRQPLKVWEGYSVGRSHAAREGR